MTDPNKPVAPELEPHCGSWIATMPDGKPVEFFDRRNADAAARLGWRVETAAQYLARINAQIRSLSDADGRLPR